MKPPWEWNEDDVLSLISSCVPEDLNLEYKRCDALINTEGKKIELSKDVSSFANSAGGTIIYGMVEDTTTHLPTNIDTGYESTSGINQEWLEQVINSRIKPRIDGIRIKPISLNKTNPGKSIFVVNIPQSAKGHMASDHRYYKRYNFRQVS